VVQALLFGAAVLLAPKNGVLARARQRRSMRRSQEQLVAGQ